MPPAPPFDCAVCARRIGKTREHYLLADGMVIHATCLNDHRLWDQVTHHGTRSGIRCVLEAVVHHEVPR